tara:strand:- start:3174 stop:4223 length:1050 start_codon:yes stop_codon:yes gene_type:complete
VQKKITITFHDIEECGIYKRGEDEKVASGVEELLNDAWDWTLNDNKPLSETCPYEIPKSGNYLRTFMIGLESSGSTSFLVSTWNETPTQDGAVASLDGSSPADGVELKLTEMAPNAIPGYPTYFWFLPSLGVYATIQIDHGLNGNAGLNAFFKAAVKQCVKQVRWEKLDDGSLHIAGYAIDSDEAQKGFVGRFKSSLRRRPAQLDYLRENTHRIRKLHRKHQLSYEIPDDRGLFEKLMTNLGRGEPPAFEGKKKIVFELETQVSKTEFDLLTRNFEQDTDAAFEDVGFTLKGESSPRWLSHSLARDSFEIEVSTDGGQLIDGTELLDRLEGRKAEILALLGGTNEAGND